MENVSATKKKRNESLKNRLEKRIRTEKIRFYFRLPAGEILDGKTDCVLHASFERNRAEAGTLFVFKNFLCFKSSLPNSLSLIIPMRFVTHVEGELRVVGTAQILKWGAYFGWLFRLNSAWGSMATTAIEKKHPTLPLFRYG